MRKQLEKILGDLQNKLDRAEELADSENDKTAERYGNVVDALNGAIESVEEAISALDE